MSFPFFSPFLLRTKTNDQSEVLSFSLPPPFSVLDRFSFFFVFLVWAFFVLFFFFAPSDDDMMMGWGIL